MEWLATLAGTLWGVGILMWIGIGSDPDALTGGADGDESTAADQARDITHWFTMPRIPPGAF